jgi:hypothetical protein
MRLQLVTKRHRLVILTGVDAEPEGEQVSNDGGIFEPAPEPQFGFSYYDPEEEEPDGRTRRV